MLVAAKDLSFGAVAAAGEPLRRDRLVKGPHSGFLAAVLSKGHRAVAINIDTQGSSEAGGFILPNDRVDVIRIFHDEDARSSHMTGRPSQ